MGLDITSFAERKVDGKWIKSEDKIFFLYGLWDSDKPFGERHYRVFAFLADVRNDYGIVPLSRGNGLPIDSEYLNADCEDKGKFVSWSVGPLHYVETVKDYIEADENLGAYTHYTLLELLVFDYDQLTTNHGTPITYREFLGDSYFSELELLKTLGKPEEVRIIFWFE